MDDTIKKTFRISKKASNELDFIRNYFNKSFGDTLENIIHHTRLRIDEEVNLQVKDELKETASQISVEYLKLSLTIEEMKTKIEKLKSHIVNLENKSADSFNDICDTFSKNDKKYDDLFEKIKTVILGSKNKGE